MSNVITFPGARPPSDIRMINLSFDYSPAARKSERERANMHTIPSYELILTSSEADLVGDVRLDVDKAQTKFKTIQQQLQRDREHATRGFSDEGGGPVKRRNCGGAPADRRPVAGFGRLLHPQSYQLRLVLTGCPVDLKRVMEEWRGRAAVATLEILKEKLGGCQSPHGRPPDGWLTNSANEAPATTQALLPQGGRRNANAPSEASPTDRSAGAEAVRLTARRSTLKGLCSRFT